MSRGQTGGPEADGRELDDVVGVVERVVLAEGGVDVLDEELIDVGAEDLDRVGIDVVTEVVEVIELVVDEVDVPNEVELDCVIGVSEVVAIVDEGVDVKDCVSVPVVE